MTSRPPVGMRTLGALDAAHTTLVLVRHGEPTVALTGTVGGPKGDTGLSAAGHAQAEALAARLAASGELADAAALYASTLPRAIETAEHLAGTLGLTVVQRRDLREHDVGDLDGLTWVEAIERYRLPDFDDEPDRPVAPNAESLTGFHTRARAALCDVAASHRGETVVIVCHGGVVAAGVGMAFGLPERQRVSLPTRYVSMTELELTEIGWRLGRYNDRYPVTG